MQKTNNFNKDFTSNQTCYFYFNNINDLTLQYQGPLITEATLGNIYPYQGFT